MSSRMKSPRRKELAVPSMWEELQPQALRMRREPTLAERCLWQEVRNGRILGFRFRRQHPVGRFIVDFYCVRAGLVVEVDGPVHDGQQDVDRERDTYLESMGLRVLRFTNDEVLNRTAQVVARIEQALYDTHSWHPST